MHLSASAATVLTCDAILAQAQLLPAAPQVLGGLCELLQDVNTDLGQISDEIRMDPALAARVIRLGNSVAFGGGGGISSVDAAVNRVGFAEIIRLVGAATVSTLVDRSLRAYAVPAERLRESLLLHALASEALAQHTAIDPRAAYAAGLLRGLGLMVLDRLVRESATYDSSFSTFAEWERACFGLRSSDVTTTVLDEWRFPPELILALQNHGEPDDDPFANVLHLGGVIVAQQGLALAGEVAQWQLTPERLAAAEIGEAEWTQANAAAAAAFARQRAALY